LGYRLAADLVVVLHLLFIIFVMLGGLLCLWRKHWAWLHVPAVFWGVWVEWAGQVCPLTPLEDHLRGLATAQGCRGGFLEHHLVPLIYPQQLGTLTQWLLGACVLAVNMFIYFLAYRKRQKCRGRVDGRSL
jgi:hypothetical protein